MTIHAKHEPVEAIVRALALLDAFTVDTPRLTLAELSRRLALPKSSVLRVARTLAVRGYLVQLEDGSWRLGPATAWLGARYQVAFDLHNTIEPVMRALAKATRHSVSYFVPEGNARVRLLRVTGGEGMAPVARVGEPLPLDKGSPGQVLLAFSGRKGKLYDDIRKRGFHITIGEAKAASASVAAPVHGANGRVVGALCIGAEANAGAARTLSADAPRLIQAAQRLSRALAADHAATRHEAIMRGLHIRMLKPP